MPRTMTPAMLAGFTASGLQPAIFVQATFVTGTVYLWTGNGPISWNGHTWTGVGTLGSVSAVEEGTSVTARAVTLTLSGVDQSMLADVLQEFQLGSPVIIYLGLFDGMGNLIADPIVCWAGRLDQPTIDVGAETAVITVNCENRLIDMNVSVDRRLTHDDAQMDNPGDLGFQFVTSIQERTIYWGVVPTSSANL